MDVETEVWVLCKARPEFWVESEKYGRLLGKKSEENHAEFAQRIPGTKEKTKVRFFLV